MSRLYLSKSLEIFALACALVIALPVALIVLSIFSGDDSEVWRHLVDNVLWTYIGNSFLLMLGVGTLTLLLGVPTAWLASVCDFPGRRVFAWALLLPLAFPAYIIAYTYTGVLDYAGPVQSWLRETTGWQRDDYWFFQIRSLGGAVVMLALVLYPYVYLLTRAALLERSTGTFEVCRTLGYTHTGIFFRLAIPLSRPAIVTGVSLALMETLADYGTVQYFGVSTFTTGIFRTFYGLDDLSAALQLSAMLLLFVALLIYAERYSRRKARYLAGGGKTLHNFRIKLSRNQIVAAWICCLTPILLGFAIPAALLAKWAVFDNELGVGPVLTLAWNSFYLAVAAAVIAVTLALLMCYTKRIRDTVAVRASVNVSGLGYAIPGTIVAIGVLVPVAWLDRQIIQLIQMVTNSEINVGMMLSGTLFALLFAYTVRFLAISLGTVQSGLDKIKPEFDDAARSLGNRAMQALRVVHVPLMRSTVLTALLIVFVDVLKELPATLILRPFNFNTLAVKAYELASDERLTDAALPSLLIVLVGVMPVIVLSRLISRSSWQASESAGN